LSVLETAPPLPEEIAACFDHPDRQAIAILKRLRELIFQTAAETPDVGELTESLKWGEPSYTPEKPRTGSSVRLATTRDGKPAAFFICHTHLVDRFRDIYPDVFTFEGNRALVFDPDRPLREPELMHCFAMALTYHLDFKRG
jgi:hypothetical protein